MDIIFGPYGSILATLGIPTDPLLVKRNGLQHLYRVAVEQIARGYLDAGANLPTVNAFFLRPLLKQGFTGLYKEMLSLNIEALLAALKGHSYSRIAISLGPANDCYQPNLAPSLEESYVFAKLQYELCMDVLHQFGLMPSDIVFIHETIGTQREALGISRAARSLNIPLILSFVVECEGHLLSGESVEHVIEKIDEEPFVEGFSLNCCSPYALDKLIHAFKNKDLAKRVIGFYPNSYDANPCVYETNATHEEPRKIESLKIIIDKGREYSLKFIGGCCGFGYYDIKFLAGHFID